MSFSICPSDLEDRLVNSTPSDEQGWGRNNYKANAGNDTGVYNSPKEQNNGIFLTNEVVRIRQVTDGLSKTALFSESIRGDGDDSHVESPSDWFHIPTSNNTADQIFTACMAIVPSQHTGSNEQFSGAGRNWVEGNYIPGRYNHIITPNGPSCTRYGGNTTMESSVNGNGGATTASSRHRGGVNLSVADGSVRFVPDTIDAATWHAMGSKAGGETMAGF